MKGTTKQIIWGTVFLVISTLLGVVFASFAVYALLRAHAASWMINNAFFLATFTGFLIGIVLMVKRITGKYTQEFKKELEADEKKIQAEEKKILEIQKNDEQSNTQ